MTRLFLGSVLLTFVVGGVSSLEFEHHDNQALENFLKSMVASYPDITKLYTIGQSNEAVELWVLAIGKDIGSHVELRPHVKYIGNMHGNEVVGREVLLHLIEYYLSGYSTNATIKAFLDSTVVHIMPTMNPDGYRVSQEGDCTGLVGRYNHDHINLNRNFPDTWHGREEKPMAPETQDVITWLGQYNFVLSANLHGGAMVANYPYDQYVDPYQAGGPSICPDDDIFHHLALVYSRSHATMAKLNGVCDGDYFKDGVTNGADWYAVAGGMQDYNYLVNGIFELTLELSCCKYPNSSELRSYWDANRPALVNYLLEVHRGVKGIITDENNNPVTGAKLYIEGRQSVSFESRLHGEYFRVLLPGNYTLQVSADNYSPVTKQFAVADGVTRLDVQLMPELSDPAGVASSFHQGFLLSLLQGTLLCLVALVLS